MRCRRLMIKAAACGMAVVAFAGDPGNLGQAGGTRGDEPGIESSTSVQQPNLSSIATTRIGGVEVPVFPNSPNPGAAFAMSGPWYYLAPVRPVKGDGPFFDARSQTVTIHLECPYETALAEDLNRAKKSIAAVYKLREGIDSGVAEELVTLQRIPLSGYEISVEIRGKELPIRKRVASDIPIEFVGSRPFSTSSIDDETLQVLESATLEAVTVKLRAFYPMRKVVVTEVKATLVESALVRVTESVKSGRDGFINVGQVTRDARGDVKAAVQTEIRYEINHASNVDPDSLDALRALVSDAIEKYFASIRPISLEDALKTGEQFVIWTTDTARIELSPEQYSRLTKSLETAESFERNWEQAFEYFDKAIRESDDYEKFYRKLRNDLKTSGSANGSFLGILSAGIAFSLENDFESLNEDQKRSIEKFFDESKKAGLDKGAMKNASYRRFTGEDYVKGATPKQLDLVRVSTRDLSRLITASAVDTRIVGTANVGYDFEFNLASVPEAYGEVRLGMMIAYFGIELPEGYVWADGSTSWPDASWVPAHLRNKKVPDMRENLVGGSADDEQVGLVFDKGRLSINNQVIKGENFSLPKPTTFRVHTNHADANKEDGIWSVRIADRNGYDGRHGMFWRGWADVGYDIQPGLYNSFNEGDQLVGQQEVPAQTIDLNSKNSNPRHVMCRWIIRVK